MATPQPLKAPADFKIGVLTSGGDAQGMNAAVRAVVRTALAVGAQPYAVMEGWSGAVKGGDAIKKLCWSDVSSILAEGGTVIGTARCPEFRDYEGRHAAAKNLVEHGIDHLVVIGGDGSLSGTDEFRGEWSQHIRELVDEGVLSEEKAAKHPALMVVGLVGSIDNDMVGTDMTIGADTALHRILDAMDQLTSTAASHQRTFVVEVMGRHCGYLPLMAAVAGGADYVFTPEDPVGPGWEEDLAEHLRLGREAGRRESIVLVAEGATDREGNVLTTQHIANVITERTGEDARVTILGHVQRGGSPSAYDRWMSSLLGYAAVQEMLSATPEDTPNVLGVRHNRVTRIPLMKAVHDTRAVKHLIAAGDYEAAQASRGVSFTTMVEINTILSTPPQLTLEPTEKPRRIGILHAGGLAPGMNTAARAAVRLGIARGWTMLGIEGSWKGLADNAVKELTWADVEGWAFKGGAELGTRRDVPEVEQFYALGRAIERNELDALIVIGGLNAYLAVHSMISERDRYPAFRIPIVLVPASIDNNLPGSELSIGADTAINNATWALDRIKESAAATKRCFVAEIMGRRCGYLTLMASLSSGAEYIYLNEDDVTLNEIADDTKRMVDSFAEGRRLFLVLVNEAVSKYYDREFLASVYEAESDGKYDVRHSALGHLQQGGSPSPFDRLLATRLAHRALDHINNQFNRGESEGVYIGQVRNHIEARLVKNMFEDLDIRNRRPFDQWWRELSPVQRIVSMKDSGKPAVEISIADPE
ncbi:MULTISPECIES: 6-phosphofructokinase [Actinomycetaceae]|uniref:6-phosphofructokinase n=1 Tax=Actinomycetaceae TaxID=2049 RepID=UPI00254B0539|nr:MULTISPECIES: 6-phosphofructokinase [unclassified Pauljensenia]MDK6400058.1 6-phosphofructokinase [Pauljensenia sp. UMB9872]MDK7172659.1 6-phosphofructokinase [Pauljensenia sp. UMB1235]